MVAGVDESEPVEAQKKKRNKEYVNGEDVRPSPPTCVILWFLGMDVDEI